MQKMKNKVAVVMSTYNPISKYFINQIQSILHQKNITLDIIIRDDGSSEKCFKPLKDYCQHFDNIYLIKGKNVGFKKSFYLVLREAVKREYKYYAYADQDDIWKLNKISTLILAMSQVKTPELVFCNGAVLKNDEMIGKLYTKNHQFDTFLDFLYRPTYGMTFVFNYELAKSLIDTGIFPFQKYAHDGWTVLVGSSIGKITYVNQILVEYRQHENNASGIKRDRSSFFEKLFYLIKLRNRLTKWKYKISEVAKDLKYFVTLNKIKEPMISVLSENRIKVYEKLRLLVDKRFTTHSSLQNFVIKLLLIFGRI